MSVRRERFLLPAVIVAAVLLGAARPGAQTAPLAFDRYHSPQEINAALTALNKANPAPTALHRIATSPGGRELTALEIGPETGARRSARRVRSCSSSATWRGCTRLPREAALSWPSRLSADAGRGEGPDLVHPAERATRTPRRATSRKPLVADERNASPWNDDMDDQADEDGPDDLDGNGFITEMRVKDPAGEWMPVEGEPRLMRKADPSKGEKGIYKLYVEGIDNDGDGEYNEDPARAGRTSASRSRTCSTRGRPTADAGRAASPRRSAS